MANNLWGEAPRCCHKAHFHGAWIKIWDMRWGLKLLGIFGLSCISRVGRFEKWSNLAARGIAWNFWQVVGEGFYWLGAMRRQMGIILWEDIQVYLDKPLVQNKIGGVHLWPQVANYAEKKTAMIFLMHIVLTSWFAVATQLQFLFFGFTNSKFRNLGACNTPS